MADKEVDFNSSPVSSNISLLNDDQGRGNQKRTQNQKARRKSINSNSQSPESHQHVNQQGDKRNARNNAKKQNVNSSSIANHNNSNQVGGNVNNNMSGSNQQNVQSQVQQINQQQHQQASTIATNKVQKGAGVQNQKNLKRKAQQKFEETEKPTKKLQTQQQLAMTTAVTFLYSPGEKYSDLSEYANQIVEIRIASEFLTKYNKYVIQRQLWGNDFYTSDSDAVCLLIHTGVIDCQFKSENIVNYEGISLFCKIAKSRRNYASALKNGFLSRPNKNHIGFSLKPESHQWIKSLGKEEELVSFAKKMATTHKSKRIKNKPCSTLKGKQLLIPELNIVFNLNNEPAYNYSCVNIADKGSDVKNWQSYKLKSHVLYLDTAQQERYEISRIDNQLLDDEEENMFKEFDQYRIAKINNPYELDNNALENIKIPLQEQYVKIIFDEVDWSDILWGTDVIQIKSYKINNVKSFKYYARR